MKSFVSITKEGMCLISAKSALAACRKWNKIHPENKLSASKFEEATKDVLELFKKIDKYE